VLKRQTFVRVTVIIQVLVKLSQQDAQNEPVKVDISVVPLGTFSWKLTFQEEQPKIRRHSTDDPYSFTVTAQQEIFLSASDLV